MSSNVERARDTLIKLFHTQAGKHEPFDLDVEFLAAEFAAVQLDEAEWWWNYLMRDHEVKSGGSDRIAKLQAESTSNQAKETV